MRLHLQDEALETLRLGGVEFFLGWLYRASVRSELIPLNRPNAHEQVIFAIQTLKHETTLGVAL